jgi:hypothetical protein
LSLRGDFELRLLNNVRTPEDYGDSWKWTICILQYEMDMSFLEAKEDHYGLRRCVGVSS